MTKFPKIIYAREEKDGKDIYYVTDSDPINVAIMGEKIKIGIYELVAVKTMEIKVEMN